jgi:hypothetical protein
MLLYLVLPAVIAGSAAVVTGTLWIPGEVSGTPYTECTELELGSEISEFVCPAERKAGIDGWEI